MKFTWIRKEFRSLEGDYDEKIDVVFDDNWYQPFTLWIA